MAKISQVEQRFNGQKVMVFRLQAGAFMPLLTSHKFTPCIPANDTGFDKALADLAGYEGAN